MRPASLAAALLAPVLLAACADDLAPSSDPGHDARTELRREHDCTNPAWTSANLGLWYNICRRDAFGG